MIIGLVAFLVGSLGLLVFQLVDAWNRAGSLAFVLGLLALSGAAGLFNWGLFSSLPGNGRQESKLARRIQRIVREREDYD